MKLRVKTLEALLTDPRLEVLFYNEIPNTIDYGEERWTHVCKRNLFGQIFEAIVSGSHCLNNEKYYITRYESHYIPTCCIEEIIQRWLWKLE